MSNSRVPTAGDGVALMMQTDETAATGSFSTRSVANSVLAGYAAGVCGTLVGHPMDSLKVWLQTESHRPHQPQQPKSRIAGASPSSITAVATPSKNGLQHTLRSLHTGTFNIQTPSSDVVSRIRRLYAGITGPLLTVGLVQSVNFAIYDSMRRFLYYREGCHDNHLNGYLHNDSLVNIAVASSTAGVVLAFFTSPMLIAKVQQQTTAGLTFSEALKRTWRTGIFVGFGPHLLSETFGRAAYFVTYEGTKRTLVQYRTGTNDSTHCATMQERMISAAASGILCWTLIFPLDALRCRLYAETTTISIPSSAAPQQPRGRLSSTMEMAQLMYKSGWRTFYRGFTVTVLRAGPVAAAVLPVYDCAMEFLNPQQP